MAFSSIDAVLNAMTRAESAGPGAVNLALYALRYRGAAIKLHELLSIDSNRPIWWEVNPTTGRPLPRDAVHGDGLDVLLQVVEFQNWRMAMEEEHRQLCIKSGKPLEAVPMQPSQPAPEGAYSTRKFELGFDRQAAIDLLSRHGVKHELGATSEDAAFEPLSQAHLIAARLANDRWNFTKEADAASEVHRLGLADQYPPGMPAWMVMQIQAGRENESTINAGLDAGALTFYQKNAMGVYVPSTRRQGAYLKFSDVLDLIRAGLQPIVDQVSPTDEKEHVHWYNATLEADHWFSLPLVSPENAALLLCQHNPNVAGTTYEATLGVTNDEVSQSELVKLRQMFDAVNTTEPKHRTLLDWVRLAEEKKLRFHSWIKTYIRLADIGVRADSETIKSETFPSVPVNDHLNGEPVAKREGDRQITKASLIAQYGAQWESIKSDIKNAAENGLSAEARAGKRGWWELAALDWARRNRQVTLVKTPHSALKEALYGGGNPGRSSWP